MFPGNQNFDQIVAFFSEAARDSELREEILNVAQGSKNKHEIVDIAQKRGYTFTAEQMVAFAAKIDHPESAENKPADKADPEKSSGKVPRWFHKLMLKDS